MRLQLLRVEQLGAQLLDARLAHVSARDSARHILCAVAQALHEFLGETFEWRHLLRAGARSGTHAERRLDLAPARDVRRRHEREARAAAPRASRAPAAVHVRGRRRRHLNVDHGAHAHKVDAPHHAELLRVAIARASAALSFLASLASLSAHLVRGSGGSGGGHLVGMLAIVGGDEIVEEPTVEGVQDVLAACLRQLRVEQRCAHSEGLQEKL
mmetsp:Transcript_2761/g.11049  ORF Transcript_2761/g.11049 Transcript_2761/m.11049 type:complete len:213 (+) Transcript_2761:520-1158(+)